MSLFPILRICIFFMLVTFAESFFKNSLIRIMTTEEEGSGTINGYSSPKYKLMNKTESYELREYEPTHWVATTGEGSRKSLARTLFMRLFKYITGDNEFKSRIAMTVPVANTFGPKEENPQNITMHFFLTESENPKPNNPDVFLTSYPTLKVYVRTYDGYTNDERRQENIEALKKDVGEDNYDFSYYFSCGYDAPWKFWNRRNEVWLLARGKEKKDKE